MGVELLLFSYVMGLVPILYSFDVIIAGRVYLTSLSKEPIRGMRARLLGLLSLVMAARTTPPSLGPGLFTTAERP
jgi:hypothetical protein